MFNFKYSYRTKDAALLPLYIVVVSLVYSFLFSAIVTKIALGQGITTDEGVSAFASGPWVSVINMLLGQIFTLGTFFIYSVYNRRNIMVASTIKGKFRLYPILVVVLITAICIFGFNYLITVVDFGLAQFVKKGISAVQAPGGALGIIITVIVFGIVPAIVEELVYRGVVFNGLMKSYKPWKAIVFSALIFMLMHFNVYQMVYQFIMGIILATICYYTGSILYSIIFHAINNVVVVLLSYFAPNIFSADLSAINIILIILGALAAAAAIVGLFILLKKLCKKYDTKAEVIEEKSEQEQLIEKSQGLSEYDLKTIHHSSISDEKLVTITILLFAVLWVISNFL